MVKVRWLVDFNEHKKGEVIELPTIVANIYLRFGRCEVVQESQEEKKINKEPTEEQKKEARYLQDKVTIEKWSKNNPEFTITDMKLLNVLPESIERYKKENSKEHIIEINKPEIIHPGPGTLISEYSKELVSHLQDKDVLFFKTDSRQVVEIGKTKLKKDDEYTFDGFIPINPNKFITLIEKFVTPGYNKQTIFGSFFIPNSIGVGLSKNVLSSEMFQEGLKPINRIFTVPVPILNGNELTFPKRGYDERFNSWLLNDSPDILYPNMSLDDSKEVLKFLFKEFCFESYDDFTNAIAALLTPFLRGLFTSFNIRTPVFFYLANRERSGKDYCAGITGILYEGNPVEEPAISHSENQKSNNSDELRKKILAALIHGRKRLHFSNNKGHIDNATFENIITNRKYSDRLLGKNEILTLSNELDFSLSGNVGVTFTPDLANRCRFVRLFLTIEDANSRKFENPDLHGWVKDNRGLILSSLYALVRNWIEKGQQSGSIPFSSFPEWSKICGGIMEAAGYNNPCRPDKSLLNLGMDIETQNMKQLFELCYEKYPDEPIEKIEIISIIRNNDELFYYLDFDQKSDKIKFGLLLKKFVGRELSEITLKVNNKETRADRQTFIFTKVKEKSSSLFDFVQVG